MRSSPQFQTQRRRPGTYGIACNQILALRASLNSSHLRLKAEVRLTISGSAVSIEPFASDPATCRALINVYDGLDHVGGSMLKYYYSIWWP